MPKSVTPIMPLKTAVPSDCRISEPAPLASTRGTTPRMKANEVMRIGRNRKREASMVASIAGPAIPLMQVPGKLDHEDRVLAGQADQDHQADLHEDVHDPWAANTPATEHSMHSGTTRITASGNDQLS